MSLSWRMRRKTCVPSQRWLAQALLLLFLIQLILEPAAARTATAIASDCQRDCSQAARQPMDEFMAVMPGPIPREVASSSRRAAIVSGGNCFARRGCSAGLARRTGEGERISGRGAVRSGSSAGCSPIRSPSSRWWQVRAVGPRHISARCSKARTRSARVATSPGRTGQGPSLPDTFAPGRPGTVLPPTADPPENEAASHAQDDHPEDRFAPSRPWRCTRGMKAFPTCPVSAATRRDPEGTAARLEAPWR